MSTDAFAQAASHATTAPPALLGIDHLEWWVGNPRAFAALLSAGFGFEPIAYAGPETGVRDRTSYVLAQGQIRFVVSGAVGQSSPIAGHVRAHGDGVHDVAFLVPDAEHAYEAALERGATGIVAPAIADDDHGKLVTATIATYGDTVHTFVDRSRYDGIFAPGYQASSMPVPCGPAAGITGIDHVVANVELGALEGWVAFYERVLGLDELLHFDDAAISTEYSALMSTVVWDGSKIVLPINEPAPGRRKSQIEEYLDYYGSPGVQHIAMATDDIIATVTALRERGVRFLAVPSSYYDEAQERMAGIDGLPWGELARLGILVDRDQDGHLLQIFSENVT
ncbi:MAG: 4-hydroxyphenylpyruvate dioxygenase, partial [Acidimicrobiales bacterium]